MLDVHLGDVEDKLDKITEQLGSIQKLLELLLTPPDLKEYEQWKLDSGLFYKRGSRKGQPRLGKEWSDAIPILYTINRWKAFDNIRNFYIK